MQDDVERRPFLVEPARKHPLPTLVDLLNVKLNECAGIMFGLPGRGLLARAQPDDDIADAQRLARFQGQIAADAVTLVEQADDGDALRHRRCPARRILPGRHIDRRHTRIGQAGIERRRALRLDRSGRRIGGAVEFEADQNRNADCQNAAAGDQPFPHSPGVQAS